MCKMKQKSILILLILSLVLTYTACSPGSTIENSENDQIACVGVAAKDTDEVFNTLITRPALVPDEMPSDTICTDYTDRGLLRISYKNDSDSKLKLQVLKDDSNIVYNLAGDGSLEDFPLQFGSGEYTARIMENIKDDEYYAVASKVFSVALANETDVFLNSVQNIEWDYDMMPIEDVQSIVSQALINSKEDVLLLSCADDLYEYIIDNVDYDDQKIFDLVYNYLPDIEQTYVDGKGICYDYASLFAAMLRSINIPTKLVKGYASYNPNVYHAWNEVYLGGEWIVVDTTKDASLTGSFLMAKDADDYNKIYEY